MQSVIDSIDKLFESNTSLKRNTLKYLYDVFQKNFLDIEDDWNYFDTLFDGLEKIIRKSKEVEQLYAIRVFETFIIQVGNPFVTKEIGRIREIFEPIYRNSSICPKIREAALSVISIAYFFSSELNWNDIKTSMEFIEHIFRASYLKGDGNHPNIKPEIFPLHVTALECWSLLFTMIPTQMILDIVSPILQKFHQLLKSLDVDIRITAGESIALIYERIRNEVNSRFKGNDYSLLVAELELLATDGLKSRSKNERKKQRQSFRDIYTAIQTESVDFPVYKVQFGSETLELNSWSEKCRYDALCSILEAGISKHLQENIYIREIFDLGLPVVANKLEAHQSKLSHKQRYLANQASSKIRKQTRQIYRVKRMNANTLFSD